MIIDFHTHILPCIDDGSKNIEMSLKMLEDCGADICVATPHFYGNRQKLANFIIDREQALRELKTVKKSEPLIAVGAEVAYFSGISRAEGLDALCIKGTNLFMLELPYGPWNSEVIEEVRRICDRYKVILAHLERFMDFRDNLKWIKELQDVQLYTQINAESCLKFLRSRQIRHYIKNGFLLGSDMHNTSQRPPNLFKGRATLSMEELEKMDKLGSEILRGAQLV